MTAIPLPVDGPIEAPPETTALPWIVQAWSAETKSWRDVRAFASRGEANALLASLDELKSPARLTGPFEEGKWFEVWIWNPAYVQWFRHAKAAPLAGALAALSTAEAGGDIVKLGPPADPVAARPALRPARSVRIAQSAETAAGDMEPAAAAPADGRTVLGYILCAGGGLLLLAGLFKDTSVKTGIGDIEVNNLGLQQSQMIMVLIALAAIICGVVILCTGKRTS